MFRRLWLVFSVVVSVTACVSVPEPDGTSGQLVIPVKITNKDKQNLVFWYELVTQPKLERPIWIRPIAGKGYVLVEDLPPARYRVLGIQTIGRRNTNTSSFSRRPITRELNFTFAIQPDSVTVLPRLFNIYIKDLPMQRRIMQSGEFIGPPSRAHYEQIVNDLTEREIVPRWKLLGESPQ